MSGVFFWFVYFTLDYIYKVRIVFIVILDRTTRQCPLLCNLDYQFYQAVKICIAIFWRDGFGKPIVHKAAFVSMDTFAIRFLGWDNLHR